MTIIRKRGKVSSTSKVKYEFKISLLDNIFNICQEIKSHWIVFLVSAQLAIIFCAKFLQQFANQYRMLKIANLYAKR